MTRRTPQRKASDKCFVAVVDGHAVRVHGDPQMSAESWTALEALVRAALSMCPTCIGSGRPGEVKRSEGVWSLCPGCDGTGKAGGTP